MPLDDEKVGVSGEDERKLLSDEEVEVELFESTKRGEYSKESNGLKIGQASGGASGFG